MGDVLIDPKFKQDVLKAAEEVRLGKQLEGEVLNQWCESTCPEIRSIAFHYLTRNESVCRQYLDQQVGSFIVQHLGDSIHENVENDFRFRRIDALRHCATMLCWDGGKNINRLKQDIADLLARVTLNSEATARQEVLDVVLEHVLGDPDKRSFFTKWKRVPELMDLLVEGEGLASLWSNL